MPPKSKRRLKKMAIKPPLDLQPKWGPIPMSWPTYQKINKVIKKDNNG